MVNLFLSPDHTTGAENEEGESQRRISLLKRLELTIWEIITAYGPSEVRLWLCNSIGTINSIPRHERSSLFLNMLRSSRSGKKNECKVATQLLRMLCENAPQKVGKIVASRSRLFQSFFKGNSRRILQWFDQFGGIGEFEHKRGARSISQFAFVNRDLCWDELVWKGRHGQSPAMVATKPHYFQDLDVLSTVENLLENVPEFWSSEEFTASVEDGEIISLDREFFVQELLYMMYNEDLLEAWQAVEEFLLEENFFNLCQRLLILLGDRELLAFLNALGKILGKQDNGFDSKDKARVKQLQNNWFETILSIDAKFQFLDEILISNACVNNGRQIVRLLCDEEHDERKRHIEEIVLEMKQSSKGSDHWALRNECLRMNKMLAIKLLAIESWFLQYQLSDKCKRAASCESLFGLNGIEFHRPRISLEVCNERLSKEKDYGSFGGSKKKKRKDKSRKRKRSNNSSCDEGIDKEYSKWSNPDDTWQLSTDNYVSNWNKVDLPEHLAKYAFLSWLKWVITGWKL
ncbi:uncharacterized protein LOC131034779 isoform X1 [Cryptomeria japonica]|uniref:uncharacterized protein LOC131034779 isoform X1 n=2 Tax=Cryptomeria japonica TaxID=3369 RepID=UPI0027DA5875|nr:uncharacterized protein LOC131034779 isoform X1 [Cryptomeria japonica]XP_057822340.2 uncharacterized protein LOC131034779 isoform X1 [Cryptomeria japonica]XP_057822341.2 uncharacterized protein LOC131034779 isoform X1 [Cryptomeria japonica]XP_057822342.2 uncharacterized protein LOC131034779 isoform X1 [Cryptomeria japonica]XP_057822344.2 uncharacterized protein LOC131034779 isoform X1 [Cryptomeria japonica]